MYIATNFYLNDFVRNSSNNYFIDNNFQNGFELGFYNLIIENEKIIGVNFQIHDEYEPIIKGFISRVNQQLVQIDEDGINVFFISSYNKNEYWIDYSEGFKNFFVLNNSIGEIALTFDIPENTEFFNPFLNWDIGDISDLPS